MFWRVAGLAATSAVDLILDKDQYTLEELLDEDDLIQECKSLNSRLINFLKGKDEVQQMIRYIVDVPEEGAGDKRTFKFPFICCEVFTCDIDQILSAVVEDDQALDLLFSFTKPDRAHSNLLAGYFSKVAVAILVRKTPEVMGYLQRHKEILDQLVQLIGVTSILEVVMKLAGADDQIMMYHADKLHWLADTTLLDSLLDQLSAQGSSDIHANAAECLSAIARTVPSPLASKLSTPRYIEKLFQHVLGSPRSMTSVIHSLSVCITLLDPKRATGGGFRGQQQQLLQQQFHQQAAMATVETIEGMVTHLGDLVVALDVTGDANVLATTYGQLEPPLGIHRLKIVEFISVLLTTNSDLVRTELVRLGGVRRCLDLFFRYHFNNFLHHHVERVIASILDTGSPSLLHHIFQDCSLLQRILDAYDDPHAPDSRPQPRAPSGRASARSGYMGHLTRIANKINHMVAQSNPNSSTDLQAIIQENTRWSEWSRTVLKKRNQLENVYQWACGRPAALDDRPLDSDDDDFGRDRDFDLPPSPTSFLSSTPHSPHPLEASSDGGAGDDVGDDTGDDAGTDPSLSLEAEVGSGSGGGGSDEVMEDVGIAREGGEEEVTHSDADTAATADAGSPSPSSSLLMDTQPQSQTEGDEFAVGLLKAEEGLAVLSVAATATHGSSGSGSGEDVGGTDDMEGDGGGGAVAMEGENSNRAGLDPLSAHTSQQQQLPSPQGLFGSSDAARSAWVAFQDIDFSSSPAATVHTATTATTTIATTTPDADCEPPVPPTASVAADLASASSSADSLRDELAAVASSDSGDGHPPSGVEVEVGVGAGAREVDTEGESMKASTGNSEVKDGISLSTSCVQASLEGRSAEGSSAQGGQVVKGEIVTVSTDGESAQESDAAHLPACSGEASIAGKDDGGDRAAVRGGVQSDGEEANEGPAGAAVISEEGSRRDTDEQGGSEAREGTAGTGNLPADAQGSVFDPFGLQSTTALVMVESGQGSLPSDCEEGNLTGRIEQHEEPGEDGKDELVDNSLTSQQVGEQLDNTFNRNCDADEEGSKVGISV